VLQTKPQPVADAPPALHTSVSSLAKQTTGAPQMHPPTAPALAGARLIVVPSASAPRPTQAAVRPRAIRNAELGAAVGPGQQQALAEAADALSGVGVTLGAGAAHLWDLPLDAGSFAFAGDGCARMLCTDRSGAVLEDVELAAAGSSPRPVPAGAEMILVQALGAPPAESSIAAIGFGEITSKYAPARQAPAVGWQAASTLLQLGPSRFAARGATLHVPRAFAARRNGQRASYNTVSAAEVIAGQIGVETLLPTSVEVVIVALDQADAGASQSGDLALGFVGGTLAGSPQRVLSGNRRLLLYDVLSREAGASAFVVSVASVQGWTVGGVVGMAGSALALASELRDGIPDHFVPDGPIAPGGSLTVTYTPGEGK
ncbi:MAG: hypothetical protein ABSB69_04235, partial [Solirubrobacteraceae bacterium]